MQCEGFYLAAWSGHSASEITGPAWTWVQLLAIRVAGRNQGPRPLVNRCLYRFGTNFGNRAGKEVCCNDGGTIQYIYVAGCVYDRGLTFCRH